MRWAMAASEVEFILTWNELALPLLGHPGGLVVSSRIDDRLVYCKCAVVLPVEMGILLS